MWLVGQQGRHEAIWDSVTAQTLRIRNLNDDGDISVQTLSNVGNVKTVGAAADGSMD